MGDVPAPFIALAAAGLLWAGIAIAMLAFAIVQTRKYLRHRSALIAQAEQGPTPTTEDKGREDRA